MNVKDNHLVRDIKQVPEDEQEDYTELPEELAEAAQKKLAGKDETVVSKTSGGKLSKWAAQQRKLRRERAKKAANRRKNKAARKSRRKNRSR